MRNVLGGLLPPLLWLSGAVLVIAHVAYTIQSRDYLLMVIGIFVPPVGIINGFGRLFGLW
jgi:hypothetical protein